MILARKAFDFLQHLVRNRYLVYELTKRDFRSKYISSVLGLFWAMLEPLALMLILWFVFGIGLRGGRDMSVPFVTYLITGISCYTYFSNALLQGARAIDSYSFLIKKVDFRVSVLPVVKLMSNLLMHAIILGIVMVIIAANGVFPTVYWVQLLYYVFALSILLLGINLITSSIYLFAPDIASVIAIVTRFLFYFTPIFWDMSKMPERFHIFVKINPMFFIVSGYRESLLFARPFWSHPWLNLYYWLLTALFLYVGIAVYRHFRPQFADVV